MFDASECVDGNDVIKNQLIIIKVDVTVGSKKVFSLVIFEVIRDNTKIVIDELVRDVIQFAIHIPGFNLKNRR